MATELCSQCSTLKEIYADVLQTGMLTSLFFRGQNRDLGTLARSMCDICRIIASVVESIPIQSRPLDSILISYHDNWDGDAQPVRLSFQWKYPDKLLVFSDPEGISRPDVFPRPVPAFDETNESGALAFATALLNQCRANHTSSCGAWTRTRLPSRLVSVGENNNDIKLVNSRRLRGQYLCLSHCWGKHQPLRTQKDNLESHLTRIPYEDLPNTFRDAISFTRALEIPYIWIDSLCIVQDDHDDWLREASRMANIYRNCLLTIAATAGRDSRAGLYKDRTTRVTSTTVQGQDQAVLLRPLPSHAKKLESYAKIGKDYPLLTRGWILQERILSPRVLHFGPQELLWECNGGSSCQCGYRDPDEHYLTKRALNRQKSSTRQCDIQTYWRDLVQEYSRLSLTKSTDKLQAVAGLVSDISSRRRKGARYLAGLWSDSLPMDLLWVALSQFHKWDEEASHWPEKSYRRTGSWRAPSWSWASIDGPVIWPQSQYASSRIEGVNPMDYMHEKLYFKASILVHNRHSLRRPRPGIRRCATLQLHGETFSGLLYLGDGTNGREDSENYELWNEDGRMIFYCDLQFRFYQFRPDDRSSRKAPDVPAVQGYLQLDDAADLARDKSCPRIQIECKTYLKVRCMRMCRFTCSQDSSTQEEWMMIFVPINQDASKYRRVGMAISEFEQPLDSQPQSEGRTTQRYESPWQEPGTWSTIFVV